MFALLSSPCHVAIGSMAAAADLPGAEPISQQRAFVGRNPSAYAFSRVTTHRNIYRIRVP